jgi:cold shock CspA family protein
MEGAIIRFETNFGICRASDGTELFVHKRNLVDSGMLNVGDRISFEVGDSIKGRRPVARNIRLLVKPKWEYAAPIPKRDIFKEYVKYAEAIVVHDAPKPAGTVDEMNL